MGKKNKNWCPVCWGRGGWDRKTNVARFKESTDTRDSWMECLWCGLTNVITRVTRLA